MPDKLTIITEEGGVNETMKKHKERKELLCKLLESIAKEPVSVGDEPAYLDSITKLYLLTESTRLIVFFTVLLYSVIGFAVLIKKFFWR